MNEIVYAYPITNEVSFTFIARQHIRYMRRYVKIYEVDVDTFDITYWCDNKTLFVHPVCYPFFKGDYVYVDRMEIFIELSRRKKYKLVGLEVADTDLLSKKAVAFMSKFDLLVFPSTFAWNVYLESCEKHDVKPTDTIVVPHGIPDEFKKPENVTNQYLKTLLDLKQRLNLKFVLFHLVHSGYRKGADLFAKAMSIVQSKLPNVVILLKTGKNLDPYTPKIKQLRHVHIAEMLPLDVYVQLYDISDVVVLTSRGGAFEHHALEGIARAKPTIVPKAGCFLDYIRYTIPVDVTDERPIVLPNNPIHIGRGWEIDVHELANAIIDVIDHYDEYKERFDKYAKEVRKLYSWDRIIDDFIRKLIRFEILDPDNVILRALKMNVV